jgi:hypothetical protein
LHCASESGSAGARERSKKRVKLFASSSMPDSMISRPKSSAAEAEQIAAEPTSPCCAIISADPAVS